MGWHYRFGMFIIAAAGLIAIDLLDGYYRTEVQQQNERQLHDDVALAKHQLGHNMGMRIHAVENLALLLQETGPPRDFGAFDRYAEAQRDHLPSISAFVFVDEQYVIRHVYPAADRTQVLGVNLMQRPSAPYVRQAVRERRAVTDDPHTSIKGELAFLTRVPIYRGDRFLGLAQGFFLVEHVVKADLGNLLERYDVQLRNGRGEVFWGVRRGFDAARMVEVSFGDTAWQLGLRPKPSFETGPSPLVLGNIWGGGLFALAALLFAMHRTWSYQAYLDTAIREKTAQLQERNRQLEQEIAQREATEESLRRSRQRLNEAQTLAHVGSWEWDFSRQRVDWSDELFRIFGYRPNELEVGYTNFIQRVHPDDRIHVEKSLALTLEEDKPYLCEYRILWPDGRVRHIRDRGLVERDGSGRPERMRGVVHDVSDVKRAQRALEESEHKYRVLMESASDGIVLADIEGRLLDGNRRFLESVGYTREELIFLTVHDIHPPEDAARLKAAFQQMREKGSSLMEHRVLRKDGSTFPVEVAGTLIEVGEYSVALGTFRDISGRKRMEEALQRERDKLDLLVTRRTAELTIANKELEAFSYSVSHDLRAPLRAINGYCEILAEDYGPQLDSGAHHYMDRIRQATIRMAALIDGLLQVSRTMRVDLHRAEVNLSELVGSIALELRSTAPERNDRFIIEPGVTAFCDIILARSLLENLLNNAWKFTRERAEAVIEFGARNEHGKSVFFVRDNGVGLDPRDTGSLFEPFHRLHDESEFEGSGIGLATVKRIVRRHGGEVWIEGKPDKEAVFCFTFGNPDRSPEIPEDDVQERHPRYNRLS